MSEDFLHFIWKTRQWNNACRTISGKPFEVLDTGVHNQDAGPDFFNAKIKIDDTIWAGNVEIHKAAGDWYSHKHQNDPAYNNVILHVVAENNKSINTQDGRQPETWEMHFDKGMSQQYDRLLKSVSSIPCENELHTINPTEIIVWLQSVAVERLQQKAKTIENRLVKERMDVDTAFYQTLFRHFGFKVNQLPFEMLARSVNWKVLAKHRHNHMQLEALLFGQAGFLKGDRRDVHYRTLKKEYDFLSKKFQLTNIDPHMWKFSRMRPGNFPEVRIAQLAAVMHHEDRLFSRLTGAADIGQVAALLSQPASEYWDTHYRFGKTTRKHPKKTGKMAVHSLVINAVVPFLFMYARLKDEQKYADKAIDFLESLPPENNRIVREWRKLGVEPANALESQALIQLRNNYCIEKKCLFCNIGHKLIISTSHDK
ncbi:MAG TPA: DUF2851 family protein [Bacteroidales bacterium]|nr:DUF2851 family protein [Bacteroidales bacterium]